MGLRIKEICKEKELKMSDLANKLGISPVSLSAAINGNPTVAWLQKVADILEVEVSDLIERKEPPVSGFIMVGDETYIIHCKEDIFSLSDKLK